MGADASEEIAEVGERVQAEPLAGGDQGGQHSSGSSPVVAAIKHPILAAHGDSAQPALGAVAIDLQIAVLRVASQGFPIRQCVSDGLSLRTLGQHLRLFSFQVSSDVVQDGFRLGLAKRPARPSVQLLPASFPLHIVEQTNVGQPDRGARQVRELRLEKLSSRVRLPSSPGSGAQGVLILAARGICFAERIVPGGPSKAKLPRTRWP